MSNTNGWWAVPVYALALAGSIFANAVWAAMSGTSSPADQERLQVADRKLPLYFEVNQGQAEGTVKFLARGRGYSVSLTPSGAVLDVHKALSKSPKQAGARAVTPTVRMQLVGSSPAPEIAGEQPLPGKSHHMISRDPGKWRTNIPHYGRVRYRSVYPGIDLVYHGWQEQLEYDFVVAPGADPKQIRLDIQGAEKLYLDAAGNLVVRVAGRELIQQVPKVYQQIDDKRRAIPGRYVLANNQIGFEVGTYETTRPLVIDPTIRAQVAGDGESSRAIAVDQQGQTYTTGHVGNKIFVEKCCKADGKTVVYHHEFGGSGTQVSTAIAVGRQGLHAYVTGWTDSPDFFPLVNALQGTLAGGKDAFIMKLAADGGVEYSTYLGGSGDDIATSIAVRKRRAYVTGFTDSTDFPMEKPLQPGTGGGIDVFVAKLAKDGNRLAYSTYVGGSSDDRARGIAVGKGLRAFVTGETGSANFPTVNPLQPGKGGGNDAFVAKLAKDGQSLVYSTYFGGDGPDKAQGIAVLKGEVYVTGGTGSTNFPTANPLQPGKGGGPAQLSDSTDFSTANSLQGTRGGRLGLSGEVDAFVAKLAKDGQSLMYSTYLGGSGKDSGEGINVDPKGQVYVIGSTSGDFPTKNPVQETFNGGQQDAFVVKLAKDGQSLVYSTYLGGPGDDKGQGLDVGREERLYATVTTTETDAAIDSINNAPENPVTHADASAVGGGGSGNGSLIVTVQNSHITVIKHVINDNGGSAVAGAFTMSITGNNPNPASFLGVESPGTTVTLEPGNYSVSESSVTGYTQTSASDECSGTIAAGEAKTCTITNDDQPAKLTVTKLVTNDNGGAKQAGDFTLKVDGNPVTSGTQNTINAGPHTVSEDPIAGYKGTISGDCDPATGSITLNPGDEKSCTITNDDIAPQLTVIKHVINDNGGSAAANAFTMNVTGTNVQPSSSFPGAESPGTTVTLDAGNYSVDEGAVTDYTKSLGTDCSGSIAAGETKTCTITNTFNPPPPG